MRRKDSIYGAISPPPSLPIGHIRTLPLHPLAPPPLVCCCLFPLYFLKKKKTKKNTLSLHSTPALCMCQELIDKKEKQQEEKKHDEN